MNKNSKVWNDKILSKINVHKYKSGLSKMKASLFAIIIGLTIGTLPILLVGRNPLKAYASLFINPFKSYHINNTLTMISIFVILGVGIGISFKTGLFNIGIIGQMLLAGTVTTIMGIQFNWQRLLSIPLMIFISALIGAFLSAFIGFLKAFFNVHEVVSAILMNWIIFYFVKWIIHLPKYINTGTSQDSKEVHENMRFDLSMGSHQAWFIIGITLLLVLVAFFILKYTTLGFIMKTNGSNSYAAKYAGMNTKMITMASMSLSGSFAGIAGFIYYSTIQNKIPTLSVLPTLGFEVISVAILAFSSPLMSIFTGLFYGIIFQGKESAAAFANITEQTLNLSIGLLIFSSALAPVLVNLKPIQFLRFRYFCWTNPDVYKHYLKSKKELHSEYALHKNMKLSSKEDLLHNNKIVLQAKNNCQSKNKKVDSYKLYRDFIFDNNAKLEMSKILTNEWHKEIKDMAVMVKQKKLSLIEQGFKTKQTNIKYAQIFENLKLNKIQRSKTYHKIVVKNIKNKHKLFALETWNKRKQGDK